MHALNGARVERSRVDARSRHEHASGIVRRYLNESKRDREIAESDPMKVSIIGGGGLVGSCAAFALQCGGVVSGIDLIDVNADLCRGQALDLLHGASLVADQRIRATGYEAIPESDLVMITAGLRRKPDESRLDLINRNVELFLNILGQVKAAGPEARRDRPGRLEPGRRPDLPRRRRSSACPPRQVIGLGTQLDTARFRSLIAEALEAARHAGHGHDPGRARRQHGPDLVGRAGRRACRWRSSPAGPRRTAEALFARTRGSGAEVIKLKGGAGFAVGLSIREVVHAVALDQKRILPVSSLVNGDVRHPRRLHLGADRRRPQGGRGPARDRALAQGSLGAPALGPGPPRDDRPGPEDATRPPRSRAPRPGPSRPAAKPSANGARPSRVTMGSAAATATPARRPA